MIHNVYGVKPEIDTATKRVAGNYKATNKAGSTKAQWAASTLLEQSSLAHSKRALVMLEAGEA
jgi:hypothetical protein